MSTLPMVSFYAQTRLWWAMSAGPVSAAQLAVIKTYLLPDRNNFLTQGYYQTLDNAYNNQLFNLSTTNRKMMMGAQHQTFRDAVALPASSYGVKWLCYDYEKWQYTPIQEQNDPVWAMSTAADIAHQGGYNFAFSMTKSLYGGLAPDGNPWYKKYNWLKCNLVFLPYAGQIMNANLRTVILEQVNYLKSKNPNIIIGIQTSLRFASAAQIVAGIAKIKDLIRGTIIIFHPETGDCLNCAGTTHLESMLAGIS